MTHHQSLAAGSRVARRPSRAASPAAAARRRRPPTIQKARRGRATRSTRTSRKARTPTTSRRSPRWTPNIFGIALVTADGKVYTAGDIKSEVSIQSISKVFTMAQVMEEQGADAIADNMGVDATGQVFNSIVAVEQYKGAEMNPLVNPGAITATSMVKGATARRGLEEDPRLPQRLRRAARSSVNQEVYKSEADTNQRNQAIVDADVRLRAHQGRTRCRRPTSTPSSARSASTRKDLAMMAATLANGGKNPVTGKQVMKAEQRARGPGGDGDRRPLRRLRQVAVHDRAAGQERRRRRHHRRVARQVRHRGHLAAARRGRQQRARRRRRSPTSRTRSAATRSRHGRVRSRS